MILVFLSRCLSRCVLNFDSGDHLSFLTFHRPSVFLCFGLHAA